MAEETPTPVKSRQAGLITVIQAPAARQAGAEREERPRRRPLWRRLSATALLLAAGGLLFLCYLRLSLSAPENSDGAANALQAWDLLHGNLLLHGWVLSDVSFYTTELPEYALLEAFRGLGAQVVNVAGALTYTLLVLAAALLAKGRATGGEGWVRALIATGIMLAPQLGGGVGVLLLQPDHVGTTVPVLAAWLVLDRGGRRWWVAAAAGLLLAWALVADQVVLYLGIGPLLLVSLLRAYKQVYQYHRPAAEARYELILAAAAIAAAIAGLAVPVIMHAAGGYLVSPSPRALVDGTGLAPHLGLLVQGVLLLFGANFLGQVMSLSTGVLFVHLTGLALAAWALWLGLRRFFRDADWVVQLLVAGTAIITAAYFLGQTARNVPDVHEMAAVLPFGAVLAGRLLAGRFRSARLLPLFAAVLAVYLAGLGAELAAVTPSASASVRSLPRWLAAHGLSYGLGPYWSAASATLASGARIHVLALSGGSHLAGYGWETKISWYDPELHSADFVLLCPVPAGLYQAPPVTAAAVYLSFGRPAYSDRAAGCRILVYDYNLLSRLILRRQNGQVLANWPAVNASDNARLLAHGRREGHQPPEVSLASEESRSPTPASTSACPLGSGRPVPHSVVETSPGGASSNPSKKLAISAAVRKVIDDFDRSHTLAASSAPPGFSPPETCEMTR